jgi:hypothetical protein
MNELDAATGERRRHRVPFAERRALRLRGCRGLVSGRPARLSLTLDASQTRRLYATYSNIARLPSARRDAILDAIEHVAAAEFGGHVQRQMVTPIYTARVAT